MAAQNTIRASFLSSNFQAAGVHPYCLAVFFLPPGVAAQPGLILTALHCHLRLVGLRPCNGAPDRGESIRR